MQEKGWSVSALRQCEREGLRAGASAREMLLTPRESPTRRASCSVAKPRREARGMMARNEKTKTIVSDMPAKCRALEKKERRRK